MDYLEKICNNLNFKTEQKGKNLIMSFGDKYKVGFLGHTDTVEYIEGWDSNPFELIEKDNKLYGLGVCDMKGGIAAMIEALSQIDLKKLEYGIKIYFTYDEEEGFGGIKGIVNANEEFPDVMIFGEPTNNEILVGSKGLLSYELEFKGKKAHSSNPEKGISANMNAVNFLTELNEFYKENIEKIREPRYEIPYTTMNVGIISGGSALNSIPAYCKATLDFRTITTEHILLLKTKINELSRKYNCEYKIIDCIEPFIDKNYRKENQKTAGFITEASFIKNANRIILGVGPVTAHEVNEHITKESYEKLVRQYKKIILENCMSK